MTIEQALDIIENDEDYLDMTKWERKHWKAQDLYYKYFYGMSKAERRRIIKWFKKHVKLKRREIHEFLGTGSDGGSSETP